MKIKSSLNKFWDIVWRDDSPKGWVITLIFLFILIKLIIFPLLSLVTGTTLPLVIVESCSMYHDGNLLEDFPEWWENHETKYDKFQIKKEDFKNYPMKNGFNKGDIIFLTGINSNKIELGDVIVFEGNLKNPVIHRVVKIEETKNGRLFSTIGDNNYGQFVFEKEITEDKIIGIARADVLPFIGWIKLIFFEHARPESERGFCHEN